MFGGRRSRSYVVLNSGVNGMLHVPAVSIWKRLLVRAIFSRFNSHVLRGYPISSSINCASKTLSRPLILSVFLALLILGVLSPYLFLSIFKPDISLYLSFLFFLYPFLFFLLFFIFSFFPSFIIISLIVMFSFQILLLSLAISCPRFPSFSPHSFLDPLFRQDYSYFRFFQ